MSAVKAQIEITFPTDATDGESLSFLREHTDSLTTASIASTFVSGARTKSGEIPIGVPTATAGERTAKSFVEYFNIDHNASGLMTASATGNVVTVEINVGWEFTTFNTDTGATDVISASIPDTFQLVSASLQVHPTEPCDYVDIEILTSQQATGYSIGRGVVILVDTNPFTVSIPRTLPTVIMVHRTGHDSINVGMEQFGIEHFYFNKIYDSGVHIHVDNNPLIGATVTVDVYYVGQLTQLPEGLGALQYSLDGVNFQSENYFTGQIAGDYTIYIKDSLGCTYQKDFTVSSTAGRDEYKEISDVNSLNFRLNEEWDGLQNGIHKSDLNILSYADRSKTIYDEKVIFREKDNIRLQFKSNFSEHDITLLDCEGHNIGNPFSPEKMSNNLNRFESLDCHLYSYSATSKGALYFTSGNTYDEGGVINGSFELNGNLPDSASIGNTIWIESMGASFQIADILYDATIGKRVMLFNFEYTGATVNTFMKSYYDLLNFEVYEFNVDFNSLIIQAPTNDIRV